MANSKQAIKRARQNSDRYKLRHAQRSVVRTAVKAVKADIDANDKAKANDSESFKKAQKVIDTAASKNVIHKNAAARTKSRLSKAIKELS
jgi:small subunit ribosomal protein S20